MKTMHPSYKSGSGTHILNTRFQVSVLINEVLLYNK